MENITCSLSGCTTKRYQTRNMCASHYMKNWRYGDPHYVKVKVFADITGFRFGMLIALKRIDGRWLCVCDCGSTATVRIGDINRGRATSCGDRSHTRFDVVGYSAMHGRVRKDNGSASGLPCADCGRGASQWSYDHTDPDERADEQGPAAGLPYSLSAEHYQPRCVPCHKTFDLARIHHTV